MSHAAGAWILNISLTLVVLFVAGLALRAIIKQHKRKKSISCIGCPYCGTCSHQYPCETPEVQCDLQENSTR